MAKPSLPSIDFPALQERVVSQFRNLDPKDPSVWPAVPRYALFLLVCALVVAGLWFAWLTNSEAELIAEQAKEVKDRKSVV